MSEITAGVESNVPTHPTWRTVAVSRRLTCSPGYHLPPRSFPTSSTPTDRPDRLVIRYPPTTARSPRHISSQLPTWFVLPPILSISLISVVRWQRVVSLVGVGVVARSPATSTSRLAGAQCGAKPIVQLLAGLSSTTLVTAGPYRRL